MDNDTRDKKDFAGNHRRTGLLREMSDRQLDVKELLGHVRSVDDKTIEDGLAGNLGYEDDQIIAVVLTRIEMGKDPEKEVEVVDLIWAGEFLDHLGTQGFDVRRKARVRAKSPVRGPALQRT